MEIPIRHGQYMILILNPRRKTAKTTFTDLNFTALCHSCKCGIISRSGNMTFQCGFPVESLIRQKLTYIYICQRDIHIQRIADNTAINQSRPIINIG